MFFDEILGQLVYKTGYTPGQLARRSGLPKATIVNWLEGRVRRPRSWRGLIRLAIAMRLRPEDADRLLQAAGHPTLANLRQKAKGDLQQQLEAWLQQQAQAVPPPPFQVIPDPPHFVNRADEMAQLRAVLLAAEPGRIAVIHGMPGSGKTSLAARAAYDLRPHFPAGVLWARLDAADPLAILASFAQAYGLDVSEYTDRDDRSRVVRNILQNRPALLVLDNADDLATLTALIPPSGPCAVLITSQRQDLALSLGAAAIPLAPFHDDWALRYFAQIVGRDWVQREESAFQAISQQLGQLPLALALAAGRLATEPGWTAAEMARRLSSTASLWETLSFAQQSVRSSFDLTYGRLTPAQQLFLRTLGCFGRQSFTAAAAAAAGDITQTAALDQLRQLYRLSLVQAPQPGRFSLHHLLLEHISSLGVPAGAVARHAHYYTNLLLAEGLNWRELMADETAISQALDYQQAQQPLSETTVMAAATFQTYLQAQGNDELAEHHIQQILTQTPPTGAIAADFWRFQGQIDRHHRRFQAADAAFSKSLAASQTLRQQAAAQIEMGILANYRGQPDVAVTHLDTGLAAARRAGSADLILSALAELIILQLAVDPDGAEAHLAEGLTLAEGQNMAPAQSKLLRIGGTLAYLHEKRQLAQERYTAGMALAQAHGLQKDIISFHINLASLAFTRSDWTGSAEHLKRGLSQADELGYWYGKCIIHANLGELAGQQGKWLEAQAHYEDGLRVAPLLTQPDALVYLHRGLGIAKRYLADLGAARTHLETARAVAHTHNPQQLGWVEAELALIALQEDNETAFTTHLTALKKASPLLAGRLPDHEMLKGAASTQRVGLFEKALRQQRRRLTIISD